MSGFSSVFKEVQEKAKEAAQRESLGEVLGKINSELFAEEKRFGQDFEEQIKRSLDERDTVDQAQRDAESARTLLNQVQDRNQSRVGDTRSQPEVEAVGKQRELDSVTAQANAANNARVADEDFKTRTLQTLVQRGTQLENQAVQTASKGAQLEQQREAANERAQANSGGGLGSIIGAGAGFAFGGPTGAMIGSQIGGTAGRSFL